MQNTFGDYNFNLWYLMKKRNYWKVIDVCFRIEKKFNGYNFFKHGYFLEFTSVCGKNGLLIINIQGESMLTRRSIIARM